MVATQPLNSARPVAVLGQKDAAHPEKSAWVAASAGTGKTKVLTDRVLSLLLAGALPEKILCLTFTKAGASEMLQRLLGRLSTWAISDEVSLEKEVASLTHPTPATLARARRLFSTLLDHPTGLTVQTLHSFCQSLLQRFPLEAGVSCAFSIADEAASNKLLAQATQEILSSPHKDENEALTHLAQTFGQERFQELFESLFQSHQQDYQNLTLTPEMTLQKILRVSPHHAPQELLDTLLCPEETRAQLAPWLDLLRQGGKEDQARADASATYLCLEQPQIEDFMNLSKVFLTQEGTPRARLLSKALALKEPQALDCLEALATKFSQVLEKLRTLETARISLSFFALFAGVKARYADFKQQQGLLDYEDLIDKACALLHNPEVCDWVRYKMDGGLDHILVDEAQDTNARQWALIHALSEEFFSGQGARTRPATLFAVGDVKQSIYRFQGAAPALFETMRAHFSQKSSLIDHPWQDIGLNLSYRSTSAVLTAVDAVFENPTARRGVRCLEFDPLPHHSARGEPGGHVEIWPLIKPQEEDDPSDQPERTLAAKIASTLRSWLDEGRVLASTKRPMEPRDVMVLMQRRHRFVGFLTRALQAQNIPVSGEDRVNLGAQLAIQDLLALGRFLLLPQDDWTLACLLKSPLVGLSEEDLLALCAPRDQSLWQELRRHAHTPTPMGHAHGFLSELLRRVEHLTVYELYAHVLLTQGKMAAFTKRLGAHAQEILYEFLALILQDEKKYGPSLQGFIARFEEEDVILKRDFATNDANEVRILTVHGSKGLQAPIVILPDTTRAPTLKESFFWQDGVCLWIPPQDKESNTTCALKQKPLSQLEEDGHRLLYVALTRAQDALYLCGWENTRQTKETSWYALARASLAPLCEETGDGTLVLSHERQAPLPFVAPSQTQAAPTPATTPAWLHTPLVREHDAFSPAAATSGEPWEEVQDSQISQKARLRGQTLHHLLEWLPTHPQETRPSLAQAYLQARTGAFFTLKDRQEVLETALRLLQTPHLARFFSDAAQKEVPITGMLDGQVVSGRMDLLLVEGDEVLIVDFKSHKTPPPEMPPAYRAQLEVYRRLLTPLYPDHRLSTWILWTSTGTLTRVEEGSEGPSIL